MKNLFVLFFVLFSIGLKGSALEIVYPKKNPCKINANSTFFIGSVNPTEKLTINGEEVKVHANGAFAHVVKLNYGLNEFLIVSSSLAEEVIVPEKIQPSQEKKSSRHKFFKKNTIETENSTMIEEECPKNSLKTKTIKFVIEKPIQKVSKNQSQKKLTEYETTGFSVKKDNIPIRTTPVDGGINRLCHLPKDTILWINGEIGSFYRVFLGSKICGWISKNDVEQVKAYVLPKQTPTVKTFRQYQDRDFYYYEFCLDQKTPFSVLEQNNGLILKLFNVKLNTQIKNLCVCENVLTYKIPLNQKLIGYQGVYVGENFILKIRKNPVKNLNCPLKGLNITVDAGHGGSESGAIGGKGDREKDINLAIAKNLEQELLKRGAKVVMTRVNDDNVSLSERVKIAEVNNSALCVSIHANALPDGADPNKKRGTSVFYYHNQAKPLAENILSSMTTELGTQNDKVQQASLALVRPTGAVSVLVEVGYIINPEDYALLTDRSFQINCAKAIADGIENYLKQN